MESPVTAGINPQAQHPKAAPFLYKKEHLDSMRRAPKKNQRRISYVAESPAYPLAVPYNSTPLPVADAGDPGESDLVSRGDHVHAVPEGRFPDNLVAISGSSDTEGALVTLDVERAGTILAPTEDQVLASYDLLLQARGTGGTNNGRMALWRGVAIVSRSGPDLTIIGEAWTTVGATWVGDIAKAFAIIDGDVKVRVAPDSGTAVSTRGFIATLAM
jgi:hypothetical protein